MKVGVLGHSALVRVLGDLRGLDFGRAAQVVTTKRLDIRSARRVGAFLD